MIGLAFLITEPELEEVLGALTTPFFILELLGLAEAEFCGGGESSSSSISVSKKQAGSID